MFEEHGLPWHPTKSLPLDQFADDTLQFTGWVLHLRHHVVPPKPHKVALLRLAISPIDALSVTVREMLSLTGEYFWFSLTSRPLLSILDAVFRLNEETNLDYRAFPTKREIAELQRTADLLSISQHSICVLHGLRQ